MNHREEIQRRIQQGCSRCEKLRRALPPSVARMLRSFEERQQLAKEERKRRKAMDELRRFHGTR